MNNYICGFYECSPLDALYWGVAIIFGLIAISLCLLNKLLLKGLSSIAAHLYMLKIKKTIIDSNLTQHSVARLLGLPLVLWSPTDATPCIRAHWIYPTALLSTANGIAERIIAHVTNDYMQRTGICLHIQFNLAGYVERIYWKPNNSFSMMNLNHKL